LPSFLFEPIRVFIEEPAYFEENRPVFFYRRILNQMEALLKADLRKEVGRIKCKKIRQAGKVPAVLYGKKNEIRHLLLDSVLLNTYFAKVGKQELQLEVENTTYNVIMQEVQRHPITRDVQHIDFFFLFL